MVIEMYSFITFSVLFLSCYTSQKIGVLALGTILALYPFSRFNWVVVQTYLSQIHFNTHLNTCNNTAMK